MTNTKTHTKAGLFVLITLVLLGAMTLKVSQSSLFSGGQFTIYVISDTAEGITRKTPVKVSGIQVGLVRDIQLDESNKARLKLSVNNKVKLSQNVQARIKASGFLGDTFVELFDPAPVGEKIKEGSVISNVSNMGDFNQVTGQIGDIATDVKAITATMKKLMAGDDSSFAKTVTNIEKISESLKNVSTKNEANINTIIANLKDVTINLNRIVERNQGNVNATLDNVASITGKIDDGEGTIGKLINDDATVNKLNDSLDNLNGLLGGANKLKLDLGYHAEYMGGTSEFKHYVSLYLKPSPDKYFLVDIISDPSPAPVTVIQDTTITTGGTTSTVTERTDTINKSTFKFSAQLAKKYYGFTFRGGLIENSGGVGIDYDYGPFGLQFSAFDFQTDGNRSPHLKLMGMTTLTQNLFLVGGLDDFINEAQDLDWFMGAGLRFTDDDLKTVFGILSLKQ